MNDDDDLRERIRVDARWAMLGVQLRIGNAQQHAELRDAHWSHRSDPVSLQIRVPTRVRFQGGVTTAFGRSNQ